MILRKILFGISLSLAFISPTATSAPATNQDETWQVQEKIHALDKDVAILKAITSNRLDAQDKHIGDQVREKIHGLNNDVSTLKEITGNRLDAQDKRIEDLGISTAQQASYMGGISNLSSLVGLGITAIIAIIAFIAGLAVYFTATTRAASEAKDAAQKWFKDNSADIGTQIASLNEDARILRLQLSKLQQIATDAQQEIHQRRTEVNHHAELALHGINEAAQQAFIIDQASQSPTDPAAVNTVREASQALESKPEKEFTPDDHFARGLNEYLANRFDSALLSFDKALEQTELLSFERHIRLLFARAGTLIKLDCGEEAIAVYDLIDLRYGKDASPLLREQVASALVNKGIRLGQLDRNEDAIAVYDEIDLRYGKDDSPDLRDKVAAALVNKGIRLGQLDHFEEEIVVYDLIDLRYGKDDSPALREKVVRALINKGVRLGQLDRNEEEIVVYDLIDLRYGKDDSPDLRDKVAGALVNKGIRFGQLDRNEEEIVVYDEIDLRYGKDDSPDLRERVAGALVNKGIRLGQLERNEEEIVVYDEIDLRYGKDDSPGLRDKVAGALVNKGIRLGQLERNEEAIAVYDEIDLRYGKDDSPALCIHIARMLNGRAFARILQAKQGWQDKTERLELLALAIGDLERVQERYVEAEMAVVLGNLGYALFLIEEADQAEEKTRECLRLGGEKSLHEQSADAQIHRVEPLDSDYEKLLDRLWGELNRKT
jgi:tetratricopeptide (TPR) repeat protein